MPVKISSFRPAPLDRVEELRRSKGRRGDPVMMELLTAVEAGPPQEIPVEAGQNAKGLRIAIARAAGVRGMSVDTYESDDEQGNPVVIVVKSDQPRKGRAVSGQQGEARRRCRPPKKQQEPLEEVLDVGDNERVVPEQAPETSKWNMG